MPALGYGMRRKNDSEHEDSDAKSKLSRLLETEVELEAMLKETRREAERLVKSAQAAAEDRVQRFESELEGEDGRLRERIARERDQAIDSIREEARQETERLDGLDDATVDELARHVVDLLLGRPESGGSL